MNRFVKRLFLFCLSVASIGFAAVLLFFYRAQDDLLFETRPLDRERAALLALPRAGAEAVELRMPDGIRVRGWFLSAGRTTPAPLLIFFGGNRDEVSWLMRERKRFPGWNILLMNYRGYGLSEGRPSQKALFADALILHDTFARRAGVDRRRVVALGRSLGTGVATYLAQQRPLAGVVLISPFDSVRDVAQEIYPFLPVGLLLKHPFDSLARAPEIRAPVLVVVGDRDQLVRPAHSRRLFEAWGGPKRWHLVAGADHGSVVNIDDCWRAVARFIGELPARDG